MIKKPLQTFLAGAAVLVPFAITSYVIFAIASWLGKIGSNLLRSGNSGQIVWGDKWDALVGAMVVLAAIYMVGLMTRMWLFETLLRRAENVLERVPGVKTIYESVRDLLKLFGGSAHGMGKVVLYHPPGAQHAMLGILTNEQPGATAHEGAEQRVCVYLPMAYMIGGPIIYVNRSDVEEIDMPVETALKLAATAEISSAKAMIGSKVVKSL